MEETKELTKLEEAEKLIAEHNAEQLKAATDEFNEFFKGLQVKYPKVSLGINIVMQK